ncbi:hypothetical protein GS506_06580 [Rhodococcus hoagii]|nr:hypothetical protein [Prescottella equi]
MNTAWAARTRGAAVCAQVMSKRVVGAAGAIGDSCRDWWGRLHPRHPGRGETLKAVRAEPISTRCGNWNPPELQDAMFYQLTAQLEAST